MKPLHIEPDHLYLASRAFWQANYQAVDQLFRLRVALLRLEMTWTGGRADEFMTDARFLLQQLHQRTEDLIAMSLILSRQADQWDESDQRWMGVYREAFSRPAGE
jgi:hypothetical protein